MPNKDNNILKYNHGENFMKATFTIYATWILYLKKVVVAVIILMNHQQLKKISIHLLFTHCCRLLITHCSFDNAENRLIYYKGQDCMEMLCKENARTCNKNNELRKERNDTFNR